MCLCCTFTLQALFDKTPQHTPTVVAEGGTHVVVALEAMRHIDVEALLLELREQTGFIFSFSEPGQRNAQERFDSFANLPHYFSSFVNAPKEPKPFLPHFALPVARHGT